MTLAEYLIEKLPIDYIQNLDPISKINGERENTLNLIYFTAED